MVVRKPQVVPRSSPDLRLQVVHGTCCHQSRSRPCVVIGPLFVYSALPVRELFTLCSDKQEERRGVEWARALGSWATRDWATPELKNAWPGGHYPYECHYMRRTDRLQQLRRGVDDEVEVGRDLLRALEARCRFNVVSSRKHRLGHVRPRLPYLQAFVEAVTLALWAAQP